MRKTMRLEFVLLGLLGAVTAWEGPRAQGVTLRFQHLTVENGLSQNLVRAIMRDRKGFMWFATENGLNRYDGYSFRVYQHDPADSTSLSNNMVADIVEDRKGRIWIATATGGLNRLDRETDRFVRFRNNPKDPNSLAQNNLSCARMDSQGVIWIGTSAGLDRWDEDAGRFRHFGREPGETDALQGSAVQSLCLGRDQSLWVATTNGFFRIHPDRKRVDRFSQDPKNPNGLAGNDQFAVIEDENGKIWIGTTGGGLNAYDPATGRWSLIRSDPRNQDGLGQNTIRCLGTDGAGLLYIGTENGGLTVMDLKTRRMRRYMPDLADPSSISSNSIRSVYHDGRGTLWVGTYNGGVNLSSPYLQRFTSYSAQPNGLLNPHVTSLYEDRRGDLWIGVDGGGLNRLDSRTGRFAHFLHDPGLPSSLCGDAVLCILEDRENRLWIGTWAAGLDRLDPATGRFTHYRTRFQDWNAGGKENISLLAEDTDGSVIAAAGAGLHVLDRSRDLFIPWETKYRIPGLNTSKILCYHRDRQGIAWMGGWTGLKRVDLKNRTFRHFQPDPSAPNSLSDVNVLCILEDSRGQIWVGTGLGLDRYDPVTGGFAVTTMKQGLPSNSIQGLLEDGIGNLWIATARGLALWIGGVEDPDRPAFRIFDATDGLPGDEFKYGAAFKTRSGELLFGGQRGFVAFYPDRIRDNPIPPPVAITGFSIFNVPVQPGTKASPLKKTIWETDAVTLSYRQSVLTFEFSALNYILPQKNRYAYLLEGFEKNWNEVGIRRTATYTNLNPGRYVLRVKASNSDGVWNEEGVSLRLRITPPFWKTSWFTLLCILAAGASVYGFIRVRTRAVERHNLQLRSEVERRTAELQAKKDEIESAYGSMKHAVERLNEGVETISRLSGSVADTSTRFDRTSRELADGATEQAGSIAEISSSLSELTVSASANAARARESEGLAAKTHEVMREGMAKIKELSGLMKQVARSSGEMEEVAKTIDEISSLIQILSINASVEAARAGEAGLGFEIVAKEVRELSGRSELAVKQTKQILHGVVERVNRSADLSQELTRRLRDVSRQVESVTAAMADIASASAQQNLGIAQINTGVEQVNKVIQLNTGFAMQTAETADGLSANSEQLRDMVAIFTEAIHRLARQEAASG